MKKTHKSRGPNLSILNPNEACTQYFGNYKGFFLKYSDWMNVIFLKLEKFIGLTLLPPDCVTHVIQYYYGDKKYPCTGEKGWIPESLFKWCANLCLIVFSGSLLVT